MRFNQQEPGSSAVKFGQNDSPADTFEDLVPSMSKVERENQPLVVKIENILPRMLMNCMNNAFKEKWDWPSVDPYTGLYLEPTGKKLNPLLKISSANTQP